MICPECQSETVVPIVYGKPGPELRDRADRREVKLGGCIVMPDAANRFCFDCNTRWLDNTDPSYLELQRLIDKLNAFRERKNKKS